MTTGEARKILQDSDHWSFKPGDYSAKLDGYFVAEELKAIAWIIENPPREENENELEEKIT